MVSPPGYMRLWLIDLMASDISLGAKAVGVATIYRWANTSNGYTAHVSIPVAMEKAGVGKNTAARAIGELRKRGWIAAVKNPTPGKAGIYRATNPLMVTEDPARTQNGYDPRTQNGDDLVPKMGTSHTQNGDLVFEVLSELVSEGASPDPGKARAVATRTKERAPMGECVRCTMPTRGTDLCAKCRATPPRLQAVP